MNDRQSAGSKSRSKGGGAVPSITASATATHKEAYRRGNVKQDRMRLSVDSPAEHPAIDDRVAPRLSKRLLNVDSVIHGRHFSLPTDHY
ncbi:hypothetical protein J6590_103053 [Homalodisca vitripennis]|nr:hypothetical protein J6590_103053 [Homalodisca vitripennis]